ncbi:amino acid ABC transporter permease [Enterococcus timonensis]|uniref:amino acid ABC transporter permease n=1 Tax=Enterococcus timonensis TaxID=1852364 RepID=UPI0008D98CF3|nr:amino acid ABC transporter permease [Enterococcus timonensis]
MTFSENMQALFTRNNLSFLFEGLQTTLLISVAAIFLSIIFGTILGVLKNNGPRPLKFLATTYIEIVRNIPNLLWIYVVFILFKLNSYPAGIVSFTIFTSAAVGEILRGGLNAVAVGQTEAARSQGMTELQSLFYIVLPQAFRAMLPAIISQFTTVIKDTSLLYSVIAIQDFTGKAQILMGRYYALQQVFILYALLAVVYFLINFALSLFSKWLSRNWIYQR